MTFNKAITLSVIMHLLLLLSIVRSNSSTASSGMPNAQASASKTKIVAKPSDNVVEVELKSKPDEGPGPTVTPSAKKCVGFGGIGIEYDSVARLIMKVHAGYPADKAGIQAGDVLISPQEPDIRGEPGTQIHVVIQRNGQLFEVTLTRELICTEIQDNS